MKKIVVELDGAWVLKHREDGELPTDVLASELENMDIFNVEESTYTEIVLSADENCNFSTAKRRIIELFKKKYPGEAEGILTVSDSGNDNDDLPSEIDDLNIEDLITSTPLEEELHDSADVGRLRNRRSAEEARQAEIDELLEEIDHLVGAADFKALAREIATVAPQIRNRKTYEVFSNICYLFSIGDGYGLTTCLDYLAKLISLTDLREVSSRSVVEVALDAYQESAEPFQEAYNALRSGDDVYVRILSVDISEWIDKTSSKHFKNFLRQVEKANDKFIIVFRVPFVDTDVLSRLKFSLNDLLYVKTLTFPPFGPDEVRCCAEREMSKYGFTVTKAAWQYFQQRIVEEKSDGKFYGIKTVKKVVSELVYLKQLNDARNKSLAKLTAATCADGAVVAVKDNNVITVRDAKSLCLALDKKEMSGMDMLNSLVGNEQLKQKLQEILAQIEMSLKCGLDEHPCIHMRFVGNPGTGKTTVARILGKILKEKGVLKIGNFYEYSGRDFCGRYIGETAPKTAGICRDAYGSVLFIDEAYSLYRGDNDTKDFGREALDTLIAEMENHRSDLVIIMAGYTDDMAKLMEGNAGLASRMPYTVEFPNFTREQLYKIFESMVESKFKHDHLILARAEQYFLNLSDEVVSSKQFSNGRFVRNLFERTWVKAALRCQLANKNEVVLTKQDFDSACAEKDFNFNVPRRRIGF